MSHLLYIESSPRKKRSTSIEVSHTYLDAYKKAHPTDQVDVLDLWQTTLPPFDGEMIDAKYALMHGQSFSEAQQNAWRLVEKLIAQFKQADRYLISLPMWNFGIPYILKHYFDLIVQPSYTFSFSPSEGYQGLVKGKPVVVVYSRGGAYGTGTGGEVFDLQKQYMEAILHFIGFTDIQSIIIEPTMTSPEHKEKIVEQAKGLAVQLAKIYS